jgi:hypothetical protein
MIYFKEASMADRSKYWESMQALSDRILRASSTSEALERWCRERGIGDGHIVALCARHAIPEALDDDNLEALYPRDVRGQTRFRRVRLVTADIAVVDALNWYFPDRLTADIREALETTSIPFGRAISALKPKRCTFLIRRCTPEQLVDAQGSIYPAGTAFEHRTVIYGQDDAPLAVVHEQFRAVLLCRVPEFVSSEPLAPEEPRYRRIVDDWISARTLHRKRRFDCDVVTSATPRPASLPGQRRGLHRADAAGNIPVPAASRAQ